LLDRSTGTITQPTLAERAGTYVSDAVQEYIPAGLAAPLVGAGVVPSEHDREDTASMLSAELTGIRTGQRVGGAGFSLSSVNETGVAVVPDEHVGEQTRRRADTAARGRIANSREAAVGDAAAAAAYVSHGTNQGHEIVGTSFSVTLISVYTH
jgi:hypothetical protein